MVEFSKTKIEKHQQHQPVKTQNKIPKWPRGYGVFLVRIRSRVQISLWDINKVGSSKKTNSN